MVDADGMISHKFFEHSLAVRVGPGQLLAAARGEALDLEPVAVDAAEAATEVTEVTVEVGIEGRDLPPGLQRDVVVRFTVPAGQHLYGEPVPEGMVAATVVLDDVPGLMVFDIVAPPTRPLTLAGTGETLQVYEGDVTLRLPVTQNGTAGEKIDGRRMITIGGEVRWQACDDLACGLPQRQRFEVQIASGRIVRPDIGPAAAGHATPMNGSDHFARMTERRR